MTKKLIEGKDFHYNDEGKKVLSSSYLEQRGYCCKSGCSNCPFDYASKADPLIPSELHQGWSDEEEIEIYEGEIYEE
jgi:hypothetical protein